MSGDGGDLLRAVGEKRIPRGHDVKQRNLRIDGQADHVADHVSPREFVALPVDPALRDAGVDQLPRIFAVENRKICCITETCRMGAEGAMGAVVEGTAPEAADLTADQRFHAREHRPGRLVREGG